MRPVVVVVVVVGPYAFVERRYSLSLSLYYYLYASVREGESAVDLMEWLCAIVVI